MTVLRQTWSRCPDCARVVPADLRERDGDVVLRRHCPEHGAAEHLYWKDASPYPRLEPPVSTETRCTPRVVDEGRRDVRRQQSKERECKSKAELLEQEAEGAKNRYYAYNGQ